MEYNPDTPEGIELLGKQRPNSMALVDEFMKDFEGDPLTIDEQAAAIAVASKMQGSFCVVPSFLVTKNLQCWKISLSISQPRLFNSGPTQGRSRAWYRVQATRTLTAGARIEPNKALSRVSQQTRCLSATAKTNTHRLAFISSRRKSL